ncbi:AraC family transcriptional regulator [Neobacillus mesonae]|nr:AraC family transcriptional regulator [Neobacillus mesonae]
MTILHFSVPPLPEYIISGICNAPIAGKHPNRKNIGIFDLLVVTSGQLDVIENGKDYEIKSGMYLILRPDAHHYGSRECSNDTSYYWLHFQISGGWSTDPSLLEKASNDSSELQLMVPTYFTLNIPQFGTLPNMDKAEELLRTLSGLVQHGNIQSLWKQQLVFQELIEQLAATLEPPVSSPASACAKKAAAYLRRHYREEFKAQTMGEQINFHPVYIARCMQKEFNCSPVEYLLHYRIEQAKLLLLQTDLTISRVAEEVGFNQAAYFTSCFTKQEGVSPRQFRKRLFMD